MQKPYIELKYQSKMQKVFIILAIFNNEFGEENVDLQLPQELQFESFEKFALGATSQEVDEYFNTHNNCNIYVYWKKVEITNEADNSHLIDDLYAKVAFNLEGLLTSHTGFQLNRATYTSAEWSSDYMHSHIPGINKDNASMFMNPCLGSGPIRASVNNLHDEYDKDWWETFAFELNRYVYVESIAGVPYRRMTNISNSDRQTEYEISFNADQISNIHINYPELIKEFLEVYLSLKEIEVNFTGNIYVLRQSPKQFWLELSNDFIEWINSTKPFDDNVNALEALYEANLIDIYNLRDGSIFKTSSNAYISHQTAFGKVLTFKGKPIYRTIRDYTTSTLLGGTLLINQDIAANLYQALTININNHYGE